MLVLHGPDTAMRFPMTLLCQERGMVHHSLAKGGLRRLRSPLPGRGGGGGEKVEGLKGGLKGGLRRGGFSRGLQGGF